ncbi:hypothetical protein HAZT_HAZT007552 [Hyalella azteca]|uniref:Endonuclease/exonuclease/phosphatase domain-containing protein n=1 Tax=Hyalella azteca TaxID=294128 RepID=A0A6A0HF25_HYAAZ|nr:hypothetical protein HAZT_HAZT007552 [Hyalella azteca]
MPPPTRGRKKRVVAMTVQQQTKNNQHPVASVAAMEEKVKSLTAGPEAAAAAVEMDEIVKLVEDKTKEKSLEAEDKARRSKNLIVFGIPKPTDGDEQKRKRDDIKESERILAEVGSTQKPLVCPYTNAHSLVNKRNELDALIDIHRPSVVGIVEVKPENQRFNVQKCKIALPGFESYYNLESKGRGICLHVKSELNPSCKDVKTDFEECMFVNCKLSNSETWTIGLVYLSPSGSEDNNQNMNQLLRTVTEAKPQHLLLLGDFNFPEIDREKELSRASTNHPASKFLTVIKDKYLIQHQREPTRLRDGQCPTLDDLVLTNWQDV